MTRTMIALLVVVCFFWTADYSPLAAAQHDSKSVDWKHELENARAAIEKNPKSAFWHNQAGVAYDALGDAEKAEKELKLASKLDSTNPIGYYALFTFYQRRATLSQQREALLSALENDAGNPLGRFELGAVLEREGNLAESARQYRTAKLLVSKVKSREYIDPRGNPYEIETVRKEVDKCIGRVAEAQASKEHKD